MPQAIEQPSMDSSAELSTETVSHHLQPLDRPSAQKDSHMESANGMFVCVCVYVAHQTCYILSYLVVNHLMESVFWLIAV